MLAHLCNVTLSYWCSIFLYLCFISYSLRSGYKIYHTRVMDLYESLCEFRGTRLQLFSLRDIFAPGPPLVSIQLIYCCPRYA